MGEFESPRPRANRGTSFVVDQLGGYCAIDHSLDVGVRFPVYQLFDIDPHILF